MNCIEVTLLLFLHTCFKMDTIAASTNKIRLLPADPNFIVGKHLEMWCHLPPDVARRSSDVVFKIQPRSGKHITTARREAERIVESRANVTVINSTCTALEYQHLDLTFNDAIVECCSNISKGNLKCSKQQIKVGYEPFRPVILNDYRVHNWWSFNFTWQTEPTQQDQIIYTTEYVAWYKNSSDKKYKRCNDCKGDKKVCPTQTENSCSIPNIEEYVHPSGRLYFKVVGTNAVGTVTDERNDYLYSRIQPNIVKNLTVSSRSPGLPIQVQFQSPREGKELVYEITTSCSKRVPLMSVATFPSSKSVITTQLGELPNYSHCTVSVRCKPNHFDVPLGSGKEGFWSEKKVIDFLSQPSVPLSAPVACKSCFEITKKKKVPTATLR